MFIAEQKKKENILFWKIYLKIVALFEKVIFLHEKNVYSIIKKIRLT